MNGKLKMEIADEKSVLEIFEEEPGKLVIAMYPDNPDDDTWLEVKTGTDEFLSLFTRLVGRGITPADPKEQFHPGLPDG